MSARALLVAGSHTEIGKTHVACALLRAARARGLAVDAVKPVVSGFDPADWRDSDPGRILAALGQDPSMAALEALSPWRYAAPLAPPMAAAAEGRALPFAPVTAFCRERIARSAADLVLVEPVGGLMSPLADGATSLDLLCGIDGPAVLVGGAYLGAMSHTLTALEVMRMRGRAPAAIVVSQSGDPDAPDFPGSVALVAEHAGDTPVLAAPRGGASGWAAQALDLAWAQLMA